MRAISSLTCLKWWISTFRVLCAPCINVRYNDSSNCFPFLFLVAIFHSKSASSFSKYCSSIPCIIPSTFFLRFDIMWSALVKWLFLFSNACMFIFRDLFVVLASQLIKQSDGILSFIKSVILTLFSLGIILNFTAFNFYPTTVSPVFLSVYSTLSLMAAIATQALPPAPKPLFPVFLPPKRKVSISMAS